MANIKDKNEPGRFLGEGVSFRAKLIGVLEVPEARGDRMCQEALADLKMAIRAAGEHKQRIQVHVAIDGLRLRDDKTGDSLYHHPVHKISFIAQDMTDSRAFGYIFGSPDTGHRFFGIKTDKAASQVVIAMRDLFQVVFELKKKEVEMAKQQLEGKTVTSSLVRQAAAAADIKVKNITSAGSETPASKGESHAEGGVAELVDLEQELSSLRRGLSQVEGLTPSSDPFGDSFIVPSSQKGLLPPPPSGSSSRGRNTPASARSVFSPTKAQPMPFDLATGTTDFEPTTSLVDNFKEPTVGRRACAAPALSYDVFTELDPLGTGRSKPYVDKKLFFQELKNPPKKVLKDLVPSQSLLSETSAPDTKGDQYGSATTMTSLSRQSGGTVAIVKPAQAMFSGNFFSSDPFAETDPFDNTDPFSDSFKDDPFTSMQEFPKTIRVEELKIKLREVTQDKEAEREVKSVFNGPLQVSLPPEPAPKSPRLQRQGGDMSSVRQRPGRIRRGSVSPPPLPPKAEVPGRPPPRPPHDHEDLDQDNEPGPPLPRPARKREPQADRSRKPRLSSGATNSSEEEYLTPVPPPLPLARRFDITLAQLLTCTMEDLAERIQVPPATLSSMTLPQLTEYLRLYLAADIDRAHVHVVPRPEKDKPTAPAPTIEKPPPIAPPIPTDFKPQFEDNFTPPGETIDAFVANFDDFDKKANPSYDRYAAFREIQELELKSKSILDPLDALETEPKQDSDEKEELTAIDNLMRANQEADTKDNKSPLKSLDELTLDSFNMFRNSVSPKPSQIDAKIEDIKTVMKTLQIEKARRSVSPRDNGSVDMKLEDNCDRYAALREITITEPSQDEFESLPPEVPKERKKSDEKSDGFDNSDFFDCIDNSSLSFTHVEDAFRKSPVVKERVEPKVEVVKEKEIAVELTPVRELQPPPARLSTGSISDVVSGSSPDTKDKCVRGGVGVGVGVGVGSARWAVLGGAPSGGSSDSRDSDPRPRRRPHRHHSPNHRANIVQTSSSSRDVSPWDDDLPPVTRLQRPASHHRDRESRHNSSGSRERLDSGSGREKEKLRDKRDLRDRDRDISRDGRDSRERDSGSGRDRRDSKEREHRRRRSRDRENDTWDRDRTYSRDRDRDYRDSRSRERPPKDYREKDRDRHRKPRHSYDDEEDYSDGCGSGRSSPRDRWSEQRWRRDERNYGSLGWRETRRRAELRQTDDPNDRRFGCTLGWPGRRAATVSRRETERDLGRGEGRESTREARDSGREGRDSGREGRDSGREGRDSGREGRDSGREGRDSGREARDSGRESRDSGRESRDSRDAPRRRTRRDEPRRPRDYRFCGEYPEREGSPFEAPFPEPAPVTKKRPSYTSLEHTRFTFEGSESAASPVSGSSVRARDGDSPATRFRFSSDSVSPRSLFEDDFTPRTRTASIAEEDESLPPLPTRPQHSNRDIKKSESVNIFTRECDPFEGDAFFAITGSDRAARRDNWPPHCRQFDT